MFDIVMHLPYNSSMIAFDASTLILLAKVELLEIFISDFKGRLLMPDKVREEVLTGEREESSLINRLIQEKKIQTLNVKEAKTTRKLMEDFGLHVGEAEALILAMQEGATLVATDDRNAIKACKLLKLEFTTPIAFLIRAFERRLIGQSEALLKLKKLALVGRYGKAIVEDATKRIKGGGGDVEKNIEHTHG